ncbi:hypothetical protein [Phenylobacterium aquaticum]|uniref:hypothetical protein n=1 Tax=Phenylobacterium aquaticum TaxID=1763816 RepID=UPI0026F1B8DA|nr:hypothetical protein [Phenylobacterium aquaticum]
MEPSEHRSKTGPLGGLGELAALLGAGLKALTAVWPRRRRRDDIHAPGASVEVPGDPGPVLEALEKLETQAAPVSPYPVND